MSTITFQNDAAIEEDNLDLSVLEISLKHGIAHMHVCGGKARCSTCRVIVQEGEENILPRNEAERVLAEKKGLECNIRLACQCYITGPVTLRRLVLDNQDADLAMLQHGKTSGREKNVAILFSDIRGFTSFSERHLSYDIIHILNRYFEAMGKAIIEHQGYIDKYIGDGMMALFGVSEQDDVTNCINAIAAALQMNEALKGVNQYLKQNFDESFEIGVGIHFGEVVLGEIGHSDHAQFTAIGDAVNAASRIEDESKKVDGSILISQCMYARIKDQIRIGEILKTQLKGKRGDYHLYEVLDLIRK